MDSEVRRKTVEQSCNGKGFLDHAVRDGNDLLVRCEDCSEAGQYYAVLFSGIDLDIEVLLRLGENELLLRDIKQFFGNMGRPGNICKGTEAGITVLPLMPLWQLKNA